MDKTSIMVVEDELFIAEGIKDILKTENEFSAIREDFTSGEEALEAIEEYKPDLILMDIKIEGEMDGIQTASIIRKRFNIPVIFLTAHYDDETVKRAKEAEPYGYVVKPITDKNDFIPTIKMAIHKSQMNKLLIQKGEKFEKIKNFIQTPDDPDFILIDNGKIELVEEEYLQLHDIKLNNPNLVDWAAALSNVERLTIIKKLRENPDTFDQIQIALNKAKSTVSHHLQILLKLNLIIALRHGKSTEYTLNLNESLTRLISDVDVSELTEVYSSLAKSDRSDILELLNISPSSIEEMEKIIKKPTSTISYNLRNLQKTNLVEARKIGRTTKYNLNERKLLKFYTPFIRSKDLKA